MTLNTNQTTTYVEDGVTFTFSVTSGTAFITKDPGFLDVSGTNAVVELAFSQGGNPISFTGNPVIQFSTISSNAAITAITTGGTQQFGTSFSFGATTLAGATLTGIRYTISPRFGYASLTGLQGNIVCFCAGTRIATVDGSKPVEDLEPGDRLRLADGGETEVRWLGRQSVSKTFADPRRVNPICIKAGTLGNERDLYVSPDHGVVVDGYLVNASALVNGDTIYQTREMPEGWTYYHVETEAHEVILAEGVPTESYVDMPSREVFDNGDERADAPRIEPMDLPRISSARLVPDHLKTRCRPAIAAE